MRQGDLRPGRAEGHRVGPALLVLRQAGVAPDDLRAPAVDLGEGGVGQSPGDLAHPVGAEVEGQDAVAGADPGVAVADRRRGDELVGLAAGVGGADGLDRRRGRVLPAAAHEEVEGLLDAVPAPVAVHREVAPDDGPDARAGGRTRGRAPALDVDEEPLGAVRRGVAPVGEGVDDELRDAELGGQGDQRAQVLVGGVHAAVADEPDQVHPRSVGERGAQHLVRGQGAVLHGLVDAREVLLDDRAGAEVEVADLRVAHLALGQADRPSAGRQLGARATCPEVVEDRRRGQVDGVPGPGRRDPPPVEDDEHGRREGAVVAHRRAASTIAAKLSTSSDAPPTRAPSTSGSASSSAALSGLTDPP